MMAFKKTDVKKNSLMPLNVTYLFFWPIEIITYREYQDNRTMIFGLGLSWIDEIK